MLLPSTKLRRRTTEAINLAARRRSVLRMDSHLPVKSSPCPEVLEFSDWIGATRRGLLAFVREQRPTTPRDPASMDEQTRLRAILDSMAATYRPHDLPPAEYLRRLQPLGITATADQEARSIVAGHFSGPTWPVAPTAVQIYGDRIDAVFSAFVGAIVSQRQSPTNRDVVLAPVGLEARWRENAVEWGASVRIVQDVTDAALSDWLGDADGPVGLYVPLVNPFTGQILTRHRAEAIARLVLRHNHERPDTPAYVFADDTGTGSFLTEVFASHAQPLGAITGAELGQPTLGRMSDWTLSVTTATKVFALIESPVVFAVTHNQWLRTALKAAAVNTPSPSSVLVAASVFCLTPESWLNEVNDHVADNLRTLRETLLSINEGLGFDAVKVSEQTAAGQHTALLLHPWLFDTPVTGSMEAFTALLNIPGESGIAVTPGELFSWSYRPHDPDPRLAVRINLAVTKSDLDEFGKRLDRATSALWRKAWPTYRAAHDSTA